MPSLRARISDKDRGDLMSSNGDNPMLTPDLRSWIDNCVVPALVREYLARLECENSLAPEGEPIVESRPAHAAIIEETR